MQFSSICLPAMVPVRVKSLHTNPTTVKDPGNMAVVAAPKWAQKTMTLSPQKRGCHLITSKIVKAIEQDLSGFKCGLAHLFLCHTSASLTINENYDYDVRDDTETFLNRIVPEGPSAPWKHTLEGPDDMPAHIKSSVFGCALTIPITNGKLNMGTWQVRTETSPEDVGGMHAAAGILTARGGMTSQAAIVARGWEKCYVSGCSDIHVIDAEKVVVVRDKVIAEGEWVSLNGSTGEAILGNQPLSATCESVHMGTLEKTTSKHLKLDEKSR